MKRRRAAPASLVLLAMLALSCRGILGVEEGTLRTNAGGSGGSAGAGGAVGAGSGGTSAAGAANNPSCKGLAPTCGPESVSDCCAASFVPRGDFYRSYDRTTFTEARYPATVSAFVLDTYEVTVGRFQRFMAEYSRDMTADGAGKNPNDASDPGWDSAWNAALPADGAALGCAVYGDSRGPGTPSGVPPGGGAGATTGVSDAAAQPGAPCEPGTPGPENTPLAIPWHLAFAFCIWDGGRLPTEAEWNYAAAGGDEQRAYPWGDDPLHHTRVVANLPGRGTPERPERVGSKPPGNGKWGHADLAGNVAEWTVDWFAPYSETPCDDCAVTTEPPPDEDAGSAIPGTSGGHSRVSRGGSYWDDPTFLFSSHRSVADCVSGPCAGSVGARCARSAP